MIGKRQNCLQIENHSLLSVINYREMRIIKSTVVEKKVLKC